MALSSGLCFVSGEEYGKIGCHIPPIQSCFFLPMAVKIRPWPESGRETEKEDAEMLFLSLIVILGLSSLLYRRSLRIEGNSGMTSEKTVRAYVDGKPVHSYVKE